ncbi:MAG: hypothetical protein ACI910_001176 [Oleispira sp.]|jgi:hypothetical protein
MGLAQNTSGQFSSIDLKVAQYFPESKLNEIYQSLDNNPEFYGAGVTFIGYKNEPFNVSIDPLSPTTIFDFKKLRASCRIDGKVVYIREILLPKNISNTQVVANTRASLGRELEGAAWSCTGAAIGWVLVIVEAGGGAVTVGAAWAAMPVTLVSTTASTFQCGVALGRTVNVMNGKANYNKWLDDSPVFSSVMTALNVIQITDVVKTLGKQALLYKILSRNGIKSGNLLSMYKQMPRASRKRLAEEILKIEHPLLVPSQKFLKDVLNGTKLLDDGTKAIKVYRQVQVQQLMATKFLEILGSGITAKGSGQDAYDGVKNSLGFIIGFGNDK